MTEFLVGALRRHEVGRAIRKRPDYIKCPREARRPSQIEAPVEKKDTPSPSRPIAAVLRAL